MTSIGIAFFGADEYPVETRPVRGSDDRYVVVFGSGAHDVTFYLSVARKAEFAGKLRALADQIDPPLACENCGTTDEPLVDADPVPTLCADCDTEAHERAEEDAAEVSA